MTKSKGLKLVDLDESGVDTAFRADVLSGLAQDPKAIPARWLYDDAGSQLFEDITQLPEYYPTRAETEILTGKAEEFAKLIRPGSAVVEFGSGSSVKTPLLLSAIAPAAYVPLDISGDFLRAAADDLAAKFPALPVHPVEADFMRRVELPAEIGGLPKLSEDDGVAQALNYVHDASKAPEGRGAAADLSRTPETGSMKKSF